MSTYRWNRHSPLVQVISEDDDLPFVVNIETGTMWEMDDDDADCMTTSGLHIRLNHVEQRLNRLMQVRFAFRTGREVDYGRLN